MEFQSKNFRLGTGLFVHAAYAAHVAVTQPEPPSRMKNQEYNRPRKKTIDFTSRSGSFKSAAVLQEVGFAYVCDETLKIFSRKMFGEATGEDDRHPKATHASDRKGNIAKLIPTVKRRKVVQRALYGNKTSAAVLCMPTFTILLDPNFNSTSFLDDNRTKKRDQG